MSGGLAYRVLQDETTKKIQRPEDGYMYPPNLTQEIEWTLFEVHIGEDPEHGHFVGILMERNSTNTLNGNDYEYFQWPGDEECPPLFYGWYPDGWTDVDPKYLKMHEETMRLSQAATRYEMCDSPNCCVRFGCEGMGCKSMHSEDKKLCHFSEKCPNYNNYYDNLLREWFEIQENAVEALYAKIPDPIPELVEREIIRVFSEFMKENMKQLPIRGFRRKQGMEFWINWAKSKSMGHSDVLFMDSWKIQYAKDQFLKEAIEVATKADIKWHRYLEEKKTGATKKRKKRRNKRKGKK